MKAIAKITTAAAMIILFTNVSMGGSFQKFKMFISESKAVEVMSKVETLVEDNMMLLNVAGSKSARNDSDVLYIPVKEEMPVAEELFTTETSHLAISNDELKTILNTISQPEELVEEPFLNSTLSFAK
jgi:hypothetical protein